MKIAPSHKYYTLDVPKCCGARVDFTHTHMLCTHGSRHYYLRVHVHGARRTYNTLHATRFTDKNPLFLVYNFFRSLRISIFILLSRKPDTSSLYVIYIAKAHGHSMFSRGFVQGIGHRSSSVAPPHRTCC